MKKPKTPKIVTVAIFTTITIIFWVFVSLYNIITSSPDINVEAELLDPIDPTLKTESLDRLEGRIFFEEGQTTSQEILREPEVETLPEKISVEPTEIPESTTPAPLLPSE